MRRVVWVAVGVAVLVAAGLVVWHPRSTSETLLSRRQVVAADPELRHARVSTTHGPVRIVGRRCGLVPNESGGQGRVFAGAEGVTRRFDGTQDETTVVETTARLAPGGRAEALVHDYQGYLDRCAGRTFGGDWEGTVTSSAWRLPKMGDDAVGMLDLLDDRGGPSVQRVAVVRTGARVIIVRVVRRDARLLAPAVALRLVRSAVGTG